jgi:imidazolonepropionase-like amidohydrolase
MSRHRNHGPALGSGLVLLFAFTAPGAAQDRGPQPTTIENVALGDLESDARYDIVLRDGRIEAVLDAAAPAPAGTRIVDGEGLLALPAFLDAYTHSGVETPEPVKDQDAPVDVGADVRVDMRAANRKGIQPAFRAAEALAREEKDANAWREAGFGATLVAPNGQLLSGTSCLATTREAAMRDVVVRSDVFHHAAFSASGPGYPSTLMGFMAQLRQFFMDGARHALLEERYARGRPGLRPPFDADLEAGTAILSGEGRLFCAAQSHRDVERWLKLADEFGFEVAIGGGRDAWRVADVLAARDVPVVLTLDWGKEVEDPLSDEEEEEEGAEEGEPEAEEPEEVEEIEEEAVEDETVWTYDEPLGVRVERRRLWEEGRDCALRLSEAGVQFAFGTEGAKPKKLLERVRELVEAGLPRETALAALTTEAAVIVGVPERLGRVQAGFDATLTLWSADPLTEKKAGAVWVFVDGHGTEYDRPDPDEEEERGEGPAEGVDVTGTWTLGVEGEDGTSEVLLTLEMEEDGTLSGEIVTENPRDGSDITSDLSGYVSGNAISFGGTLEVGDFTLDFEYELELDGDLVEGEVTYDIPGMPQPLVRGVEGVRDPEHRNAR